MGTKKGYSMYRLDIKQDQAAVISTMGGSLSNHIENALDLYLNYKYTVYKITDTEDGSFFISFYDYSVYAEDIYWHFVNTRGNESIGHSIREKGIEYFTFDILFRCHDHMEATRACRIYRKLYSKKYGAYDL